MKTVIKIVLWLAAIFFGYMIYQSVNGPIEFKKVKQERFQAVVNSLKDIRDVQEAHKSATGKFAPNFKALVNFVEKGNYYIIQQRDSSYMEYDKGFGIDLQKDVKILDTLSVVPVKDSLFKSDKRYERMMFVPFSKDGKTEFKMSTATIEKGGKSVSVFKASTKKDVVLYDQPKDLTERENVLNSVEEINGDEIIVGDLEDVSTSGNWPPIYDRKTKK
ncbi:hypothetical protein M4I21_03430 [Cellulophaga sp. 20_2_10]|uniref:hypothetical protein n=1 Tax=Cellulophaga sp. 20_2_10 TaxID=2942476 RepID=UPI00201B0502|nr:hypothetical protein [Cellulophaga sp. 20_2_10]MCL5244846.1 hypothetical protein [Cellulophaga sp. 20_2_10]